MLSCAFRGKQKCNRERGEMGKAMTINRLLIPFCILGFKMRWKVRKNIFKDKNWLISYFLYSRFCYLFYITNTQLTISVSLFFKTVDLTNIQLSRAAHLTSKMHQRSGSQGRESVSDREKKVIITIGGPCGKSLETTAQMKPNTFLHISESALVPKQWYPWLHCSTTLEWTETFSFSSVVGCFDEPCSLLCCFCVFTHSCNSNFSSGGQ